MPYLTERDSLLSVTLAGVTFPSSMEVQTWDGGDPVAATSQLFPGGNHNAIAMPGPVTRTNLTLEVAYSTDVDAVRASIDQARNRAMSASFTPKDGDGNPNGKTTTRTGIFKGPVWPKGDAKSGNPMMFSLVMECDV